MSGDALFDLPEGGASWQVFIRGQTRVAEHGATFSHDGVYRYSLTRRWDVGSSCLFVMLNPSTADASRDDPTVRRCIGFAQRWGWAGLIVVNVYGYRATHPGALWAVDDPVGPDNDAAIVSACEYAAEMGSVVVAAWGSNAEPDRLRRVRSLTLGLDWSVLGFTRAGQPRHPLYMRGDTEPQDWPWSL
ncbi:MAG: DUF1643 domain-containing protein [Nocardioidaceae bacterium]